METRGYRKPDENIVVLEVFLLKLRCLPLALTIAFFWLMAARMAFALAPAGTVILNQAEAVYFDTRSGEPVKVLSNQSTIQVAEVQALLLTQDQSNTVAPGQTVFFIHHLKNRGNSADRYQLAATACTGINNSEKECQTTDLLKIEGVFLYQGGLPAPGTEPLTETPLLEPGEVTELVVMAQMAITAKEGDLFTLKINAFSKANNKVTASNYDKISVSQQSVLIRKSSQLIQGSAWPKSGSLDYDIRFTNNSNLPLVERALVIDGQEQKGVLLEDRLPPNTLLADPTSHTLVYSPIQAEPVVYTKSHQWIRYSQWHPETMAATRVGLMMTAEHIRPGQSGHLKFKVTLAEGVQDGTIIRNTAAIDLDGDDIPDFVSNETVDKIIGGSKKTLSFTEPVDRLAPPAFDKTFIESKHYFMPGQLHDGASVFEDVYLELKDQNFNLSPEKTDFVDVRVTSGKTGDQIIVRLRQAGSNSGLFKSVSPLRLSDKQSGNGSFCSTDNDQPDYTNPAKACYLRSEASDTLRAEIIDPMTGDSYQALANVSPDGIVFDSASLEPLAGAVVRFFDINDEPARPPVNTVSQQRPAELIEPQTTDASGRFYFPRMREGFYYIKIETPNGYQFPSKTKPEDYTGLRVSAPSYGKGGKPMEAEANADETGLVRSFSQALPDGAFRYGRTTELTGFDVPLDKANSQNTALLVEKKALQSTIAPGELVGYEVKVTNNTELPLFNIKIHDGLPLGFKYARNSVRIEGKAAAEPDGAPGPELTFVFNRNNTDWLELAPGQSWTLTYALKAGAGAIDSDGINTAQANGKDNGGTTVYSNKAKAQVTVQMDGVLSDKAILFGKVYVDSNCNNLQDSGEWPIGGVRLYMEDGTWAITDENGQYSLMGLKAGNHVVKVDPVTLPDGLILKPLDNRNAADGNSRFADLAPGEMHRADFAAMCPTGNYEKIFAQIKARNESITGDWLLDDAAQYNRSKPTEKADNTGDLSHGVIRAPREGREQSEKKQEKNVKQTAPDITKTKQIITNDVAMPLAKDAVKTITRDQGMKGTWLWPQNQQADGRFMAVVRAGIQPSLYINGKAVGQDRLGEQLLNNQEQAQLLAWYGVALEDGENQVEIKATDFFGNERVLAKGVFTQSGSAEKLEIKPESDTLPADEGRSVLPVTIRLLDKNSLPARGVYFVTLEATSGRWQEPDIQDQEPGHQVRIENGELTVHLRSGSSSGPVTLRASTGELKTDIEITQVAAPRPLVAAGLVEMNAGHGSVRGPVTNLKEITDGSSTDSRAAMFIKGEVAKDIQLTLSYDSDKDDDAELFRDVDPDDYYPITGDASQKGYEAQSRSKLYAKVEKDRSSIMWGDYQTDSNSSENDLAKIQRSLTGVNGIYDNGETRVQGFAAQPEDNHVSEIILPNGTAMHYRLKQAPIVRHSETVVLEKYDRDNPGLMIKSETMTRGRDYTLDEFSGYLKFSKPIHSKDDDNNSQKIRVNYDVEGDGEAYTVAGARVEQKLGDKVKVGASYTHDGHKSEGSDIHGAWVEYKPTDKTTIAVSGAHMTGKSAIEGSTDKSAVEENSGIASRVKLKHQWNNASESELTWARADKHYTNSAGGVSAGREETRLQHKQQLTKSTDLRAEAEMSQSLDSSDSSQGDSVGAYVDHKVGDGWKLTAGSRYIRQRNEHDHDSYMTGQVGAEKRFKLLEKEASIRAEYEQALSNPRWRAALESDWKVHDKVSLYGRFERDDNLSPVSSGSDRNQFSLGLKSDWLPNTKSYSEYRMRGATDGQNLEWVNGTETRLELMKGLSITPSVEWINTVSGNGDNDGLALSMGVQDKRHKNQRATGRVEYRNGKQQDYYGLDGAVARRLSLDWSGLLREEFRLELPKEDGKSKITKHAMTLGMARRPKLDNRQHGLYMYQWKEERGQNQADNRTVHLISTHQNRQVSSDLTLSGRIGSKWVSTALEDYRYDSQTWVTDARLTWDIDRRWDVDMRGGLLAVDGTDSMRWSAGIGVYYLVVRNLRVGAYYNVVGFSDKDLDSEEYNAEGVHLSMQFKFDESLFDWFTS